MWLKNLWMLGLCVGGFVAAGATLFRTDAGAVDRRHLAPVARHSFAETLNRLNVAFEQEWSLVGAAPAPRADRLTVARRLALGLAGTTPSLEEIRVLEAWPEDLWQERWLDHLLADRRSADYLAERFARSLVGVDQGPFLLYRRRRLVSWLGDQFYAARPYDAIVRDLIGSGGLWTDHPATNFITATLQTEQENRPDVNKLATRVSRGLLGVRLDCAECHDHPFDPRWSQHDFQALAAFFAPTRISPTGLRDDAGPYWVENEAQHTRTIVAPAAPFLPELLPENGTPRQRLAAWVTHRDNRAFARATVNRVWTLLLGRPLTAEVDEIPTEGPLPPALEILAEDFAAENFSLQRLIRLIAASTAFQRASDESEGNAAWASFPLTRLRPEQVIGGVLQASSLATLDYDSHILVRLAQQNQQREFLDRYGDAGGEELVAAGGTIPQRLLLLNGQIVHEKLADNLLANAATRIAVLAPDDAKAVENAYLAVLTRRPTAAEQTHFAARLKDTHSAERNQVMSDLYWALINSTEFSWNH